MQPNQILLSPNILGLSNTSFFSYTVSNGIKPLGDETDMNFAVLCLCTRYPLRWFVQMVSTPSLLTDKGLYQGQFSWS